MRESELNSVITPLKTDEEKLSLQVARYASHVAQINEIMNMINATAADIKQLDMQRSQKMQDVQKLRATAVFFVAEAREQVGALLSMGMTQDEVDKIAKVNEAVRYVDITEVLSVDVKKRLSELG